MGYLGKEIRNHVIVCLGIFPLISGGCHGRDCTVVGTTCVFSAYHHYSCEFKPVYGEVYSIHHYVIKFVSDLRQVGGFLLIPPSIKLHNMTVTI